MYKTVIFAVVQPAGTIIPTNDWLRVVIVSLKAVPAEIAICNGEIPYLFAAIVGLGVAI